MTPEELRATGQSLEFTETGHEHLWQKLAESDPEIIARRAEASLAGERDFQIKMLGADYLFETGPRRVTGPSDRLRPDKRVVLCLLNYLNGARETGLTGRMGPETVLPGGERFFSGGHALSRRPLLDAYGRDGAAMLEKARRLGGEAVEGAPGTYSFRLSLLPKIPVQVTLCQEDEEFPAEVYYAFDSSAADHVPLGIVSALVGLLNDQLAVLAD